MNEGQVKPVLFPTYNPPVLNNPSGVPMTHPKHAAFLMKAIKSVGHIKSGRMPTHGKKTLHSRQSVRIKHRKIGY